jgi:hypothetical protein
MLSPAPLVGAKTAAAIFRFQQGWVSAYDRPRRSGADVRADQN